MFYNILDLAAINSWILYQETTGASIIRRNFILKLADELSKPYAQGRAVNIRASAKDVMDETHMQVRGTKAANVRSPDARATRPVTLVRCARRLFAGSVPQRRSPDNFALIVTTMTPMTKMSHTHSLE